MVEVRKYQLPPTELIPNSPRPLLHYPGILLSSGSIATAAYDAFSDNGWRVQWIFRYGPSQVSHYHSATHECMAVLSGTATIRFGVADTVPDLDESTQGSGKEDGGIELQAHVGDVFIIPAGVAHKTFNTEPSAEFKLLTPGDGHHIAAKDVRRALEELPLSGFTMIGAYPEGGAWDFAKGGESTGNYEAVWAVSTPEKDPVLAKAEEGLCGQWK
ncbi:hypothetical protein AYL99_07002 [Fonsecaea erecta]|uniref:Cupin type-1 domain-containing protein n=1 Tax=Fonsecaea erecta TaxID=1367422 RepID=A0A178ZIU3_9EURO|nr:hypothetical protein AYL99_07002 [Fonsecaea erecta]OAP59704.1 hypothetical protein AYL99_07002 [Fonsecaea erecta]